MGKKRPKQRPQAGLLGKTLTRRSKGKCELCESKDQPRPYELWPFPDMPDENRTILACQRCRSWLDGERFSPVHAHFLSQAIWSETAPVKLAAARLLLATDSIDDPWLQDALEAAQVDPHTLEFNDSTL